jgi:hypothetical protein
VGNKLKIDESRPCSAARPLSAVRTAALHAKTGDQVLSFPARYSSRRFRTPEDPPICDQALAPADAWAVIGADGLVRWCAPCKRFRAGICAGRGPLPS